ncbi:MAG: DUF448 domain-containing protein [Campylobacteraceae bacterium]
MCVVCKERLLQDKLYRFQIKEGVLVAFSKQGRSFYLCNSCLENNQQKLIKILNNKFKLKLSYGDTTNGDTLKEIAINGR